MADVYCIVNQTIKLKDVTRKITVHEPLAYDNAQAHAMQVTVFNDEAEEDLTGVGVVGSFMKADGNTVTPINGTVSGNVAKVVLPASCYVTPGRFKFTMNLSKDGVTRTVLWVEGHVEKNVGGTIIDPGTPVGNISTAIAEAQAAATAAEEATENAEGFTGAIAPTFEDVMATSPFVPFGAYVQHVWHEGTLYVNNVDIDTVEAWNAEHWDVVDVSGELSWCLKRDSDVAGLDEAKEYLGIT